MMHTIAKPEQTASPTIAESLEPVWSHLNNLCDENGNQALDVAAATIEVVTRALRDRKPVHPEVVARLLDGVVKAIREANRHVGGAIVELGEVTYCS